MSVSIEKVYAEQYYGFLEELAEEQGVNPESASYDFDEVTFAGHMYFKGLYNIHFNSGFLIHEENDEGIIVDRQEGL